MIHCTLRPDPEEFRCGFEDFRRRGRERKRGENGGPENGEMGVCSRENRCDRVFDGREERSSDGYGLNAGRGLSGDDGQHANEAGKQCLEMSLFDWTM